MTSLSGGRLSYAAVDQGRLQDRLSADAQPLIDAALAAGMGSGVAVGVVTFSGVRATCVRGTTIRVRQTDSGQVATAGHMVSSATPFDVASLTKPMATSTLLAASVAAGHVTLSQPLARVLPQAVGTPLGACTLGALLSHTSGAIAWRDFYADTAGIPTARRAEAIVDAVLHHPLRADLPSNGLAPALYSDLGFIALGRMLSVLHDAPLDELFANRVAAPLQIQASFRRIEPRRASSPQARASGATRYAPSDAIVATEIWPPRCATGEALQGEVHDDNCAGLGGVAGHAGVFASLDDVLTWAHTWLRAYAGGSTPLGDALPTALVRRWLASPDLPTTTWRHGFDTPSEGTSSAGRLVSASAFGHLGFTGTGIWIDPDRGAAIALLTNRVHPSREDHSLIRAFRPRIHDLIWRALDG